MSHVAPYRTGWEAREAAAVLGYSLHTSPLEVVLRKKGKRARPDERLTRKLHRVVLDSYMEQAAPTAVERQNRLGFGRLLRYPHLISRPDARVILPTGERRIVQANSCTYADRSFWGKPGTQAVPKENYIQAQLELGVGTTAVSDVCVFFGGTDFRVYEVRFDAEIFDGLATALEQAWKDWVEGTVLPPVDASQACFQALSEKFAERKGDLSREATEPEKELLKEAFRIRKEMRPKEQRLKEIVNKLKTFIGEGYGVHMAGLGRVLFAGGETKTEKVTDWERFGEAALLYFNAKDPEYGRELLAEHRREKTTITNRTLKFYEE